MIKENAPVKQFRAGAVCVSVFKRIHDDKTFFNATATRAYTKDDGNSWDYSDSFDRDDLPLVAALFNQAFSFIVAQQAVKPQAKG